VRQRLGHGLVIVQAAARAVPVETVPDVEVLLEVMTVITRYSRARYGTWAFQAREWTRGSIGTKTRDSPPEPNTS